MRLASANRTAMRRRDYFTARIDAARAARDHQAQVHEAIRYLRAAVADLHVSDVDAAVADMAALAARWAGLEVQP
jgi:transcription elongation GreA/GreB family factor